MKARGCLFTKPNKKVAASIGLFLLLLGGCQPSPERDVVVNKNESILAEVIQHSVGGGAYSYPKHKQQEFSYQKFSISFDSLILVPDVTSYPVIRVEDSAFTQKEADTILAYLVQDGVIQHPTFFMTKAGVMQEIEYYRLLLQALEEGKTLEDSSYDAESVRSRLAFAQQSWAQAPDDPIYSARTDFGISLGKELEDIGLGMSNSNDGVKDQYINVDIYRGDERYNLQIQNEYASTGSVLSQCIFARQSDARYSSVSDEYCKVDQVELQTSQEEAERLALETATALGVESPVLSNICGVRRSLNYGIEEDILYDSYLWQIDISSTMNGIPVLFVDDGSVSGPDGDQQMEVTEEGRIVYNLPLYNHETFRVFIGDTGIDKIYWTGRMKAISYENDDVALMPFENVFERISSGLRVMFETGLSERSYIKFNGLHISQMQLGFMRLLIQDQPGKSRLIPAWQVVADSFPVEIDEIKFAQWYRDMYGENPGDQKEIDTLIKLMEADTIPPSTVLFVNALDGSIIDAELGY